MDRELDLDAALVQLIVELTDLVLRLRNGHSITRHYDDAVGIRQELRDVL
jgi:hypothetical protein